jgi:membrane protein YqaA with SNARE-associated domain
MPGIALASIGRGPMRALSQWLISIFTSPLGVVVLGALDSTLFFSLPFGIDAAVIILSARLGSLAWTVPLLATAGSIAGAALTFWMGVMIGENGLDRYVPARRLERIRARIRVSGAVALAILDLIPPPFPFTPFVLAAGALEVKASMFFITLTVCRVVRFGIEAALAQRYGRRVIAIMDSDLFQDVVIFLMIVAFALTALSIIRLVRSSRPAKRAAAP